MAIFENKTTETTKEKKPEAAVTAGLRSVLVKPRISEKAAKANNTGVYIFEVSRNANKVEVKKAVEKSYNVRVVKVNIVNTQGKTRTYGRTTGKMSNIKKAIVTLKEGDKIETPEVG